MISTTLYATGGSVRMRGGDGVASMRTTDRCTATYEEGGSRSSRSTKKRRPWYRNVGTRRDLVDIFRFVNPLSSCSFVNFSRLQVPDRRSRTGQNSHSVPYSEANLGVSVRPRRVTPARHFGPEARRRQLAQGPQPRGLRTNRGSGRGLPRGLRQHRHGRARIVWGCCRGVRRSPSLVERRRPLRSRSRWREGSALD